MHVDEIPKDIKKALRKAFWFGVLLGLIGRLAIGLAWGYSYGDKTIVIPLTQVVKV